MSLLALTRDLFLSGFPAEKWEAFVREWADRHGSTVTQDQFGNEIWGAIRPLLTVYPRDRTLAYLRTAITSELLPLHVLVSRLLTAPLLGASNKPEDLSLLDTLCQLALVTHLARNSGGQLMPTPKVASVTFVIDAVHNGIELVKFAFSLPPSEPSSLSPTVFPHSLPTSAPELLCLILDSLSDTSLISSAEVAHLLTHLNDIMRLPLSPATAQRMSEWTNHLTFAALHAPEDIFATLHLDNGEAITMQNLPLAPQALSTSVEPVQARKTAPSDGHDVTSSMLLRHLVRHTATVGCGNTPSAVAHLLATFRSMGSNALTFTSNLLGAALQILSRLVQQPYATDERLIWTDLILVRIPQLLKRLDEIITGAGTSLDDDFRSGLRGAIAGLFSSPDLLDACNSSVFPPPILPAEPTSEFQEGPPTAEDSSREPCRFKYDFLHAFVAADLVDYTTFAVPLLPDLPSDPLAYNRLLGEAQELGVPIEAYLSFKFEVDIPRSESLALIDRVLPDFDVHPILVEVIIKMYNSGIDANDMETASALSQILYTHPHLLDILSLQTSLIPLIERALACIEAFDYVALGDAQTALGQYGDVALFVQTCLYRYHLTDQSFVTPDGRILSYAFLTTTWSNLSLHSLLPTDRAVANSWLKAIFDSNSEGIDDELLRSTSPQLLLRLASTIFIEAINAFVNSDPPDRDTLMNGISYFLGPLLNWTLPGVLLAITSEIERQGPSSSVLLEILKVLVIAPGCPRPAILIAGSSIYRILDRPSVHRMATASQLDLDPIGIKIDQLMGVNNQGSLPVPRQAGTTHADAPQLIIREALEHSSDEPLQLPLRHLLLYGPHQILSALFYELRKRYSSGNDGGDAGLSPHALAISTCIMNAPREMPGVAMLSASTTLLPFALEAFVPVLLAAIDQESTAGPDGNIHVDVLCSMIGSSVLSAWHMERARQTVESFFAGKPGSGDEGENANGNKLEGEGPPRWSSFVGRLVNDFIQWLLSSDGPSSRGTLLQKLRSTPEYAGHFVL